MDRLAEQYRGPVPDAALDATDELFARLPAGSIPMMTLLGGSHSYGSERPDSDFDLRSIYVVPLDELLRVWGAPPRTLSHADEDVWMWELEHFVSLAGRANPNALELLWAPVVNFGPFGWHLRANRHLFLSRLVYTTHLGYARGQLGRAMKGTGGSRGQAHLRREKFLFHTLRIAYQARRILEQGADFTLRLSESDRDYMWSAAQTGDPEVVARLLDEMTPAIRAAYDASRLPERADQEALNQLVLHIRRSLDAA